MKMGIGALKSEQDQDDARALEWWRGATNSDRKIVWDEIQKSHLDSTVKELVYWFAQIGFTRIAILAAED
jgi:hypothetical protein